MASEINALDTSLYRPEFNQSWEPHQLYDLAEWTNGLAYRAVDFSDSGLPIIKIAELKAGLTAQTGLTEKSFLEKYRVQRGDMLFSWSGQPETSIDTFIWQGDDGWLNQHIFRVVPKTQLVSLKFFRVMMRALKPTFVALARNKQTTGLGHVTIADLKRIQVRIPDNTTQELIAELPLAIEERVRNLSDSNASQERMARDIYKSWFVSFDPVTAKADGREPGGLDSDTAALFPDEFEHKNGKLVPKGWTNVRLENVTSHITKGTTPTTLKKRFVEFGIPFLKAETISDLGYVLADRFAFIDHETDGLLKRSRVQGRDVLLTIAGTVGRVAEYPSDLTPANTNQAVAIIRPKDGGPPPSFLTRFLREDGTQQNIRERTVEAVQANLSLGVIRSLELVIPPLPLLTELCDKSLSALDASIRSNVRLARTLLELRDTLLPRLISGRLRVPEAEKLVGAVL